MYEVYDDNCSRINDPKIEDERKNLVPLFELGLKQFQKICFQLETFRISKKVEVEIDDIPFIGYTDFHLKIITPKGRFFY